MTTRSLRPIAATQQRSSSAIAPGSRKGVFAGVELAYRTILALVASIRPDVRVLLHNYDYAIPDGRTLPGMRSWLKLPMDNERVPAVGAPRGGRQRTQLRPARLAS